MRRRLEMEKEMERHERERIQTARPGELEKEPSPPITCADGNFILVNRMQQLRRLRWNPQMQTLWDLERVS